MLRNVRRLYGYRIEGSDGRLGKIHDMYYDDRDWRVRYLVLDTGALLGGRHVPISPEALGEPDWEGETLAVDLTTEQVRDSPEVAIGRPPTREQEAELRQYYRWPLY